MWLRVAGISQPGTHYDYTEGLCAYDPKLVRIWVDFTRKNVHHDQVIIYNHS